MKFPLWLSAWRRWSGWLLAALLGLGVLAWQGPNWLFGPRVEVLAVVQRDFVQSVVASGRVETPHRVSIGAQITGLVRQVPVAEGQGVQAGQTLIELDSAELQATAAQADLAVAQARARLRQLREVQAPVAAQALRQAQTSLDNARRQWSRSNDLFRQGFVGQAALDEAQKTVDLAESQRQAAQAQLDTLQGNGSDVAVANAALEQAVAAAQAARSRLLYATVKAPVAGTLIARSVEPGDVVQPGKQLMALSPTGLTQLVVQIDEKNLQLLNLGQPARASAEAWPNEGFAARLSYINPGINLQRGSVEVKLTVEQPPAYLRQDMTVSVDIEVARRPAALLVRTDALREASAGQAWVLKVEAGQARRQTVRLGLQSAGWSEVLQGLQAGEQVVPAGAADIRDGSRLRAVTSANSAARP